eukprot:3937906-Rhodomonas_salina.2
MASTNRGESSTSVDTPDTTAVSTPIATTDATPSKNADCELFEGTEKCVCAPGFMPGGDQCVQCDPQTLKTYYGNVSCGSNTLINRQDVTNSNVPAALEWKMFAPRRVNLARACNGGPCSVVRETLSTSSFQTTGYPLTESTLLTDGYPPYEQFSRADMFFISNQVGSWLRLDLEKQREVEGISLYLFGQFDPWDIYIGDSPLNVTQNTQCLSEVEKGNTKTVTMWTYACQNGPIRGRYVFVYMARPAESISLSIVELLAWSACPWYMKPLCSFGTSQVASFEQSCLCELACSPNTYHNGQYCAPCPQHSGPFNASIVQHDGFCYCSTPFYAGYPLAQNGVECSSTILTTSSTVPTTTSSTVPTTTSSPMPTTSSNAPTTTSSTMSTTTSSINTLYVSSLTQALVTTSPTTTPMPLGTTTNTYEITTTSTNQVEDDIFGNDVSHANPLFQA